MSEHLSSNFVPMFSMLNLTQLIPPAFFYTIWKHKKNRSVFDLLMGFRKRPVTWNGFITKHKIWPIFNFYLNGNSDNNNHGRMQSPAWKLSKYWVFLVRIFLHSVRIQKKTDEKNSVFGQFSTRDLFWLRKLAEICKEYLKQ